MKIRKLILRAKLEYIEKQNQNIFIFHCCANATQWRFLKNFLYNQSSLDSKAQRAQTKSNLPVNKHKLLEESTNSSRFHGFTFFQSTSFNNKKAAGSYFLKNEPRAFSRQRGTTAWRNCDQKIYLSNKSKKKHFFEPSMSANLDLSILAPQSLENLKNSVFKPKGCLFYFVCSEDLQSKQSLYKTQIKNNACGGGLNLIKKVESLDFNNNLILLYGQMNSTLLNHVDIKDALTLKTELIYQKFCFSMHSLTITFSLYLHYHIDNFFYFQYLRKHHP